MPPWPSITAKQLDREAKRHLHVTITDLNRRQIAAVVRFKGDGTGTRIG